MLRTLKWQLALRVAVLGAAALLASLWALDTYVRGATLREEESEATEVATRIAQELDASHAADGAPQTLVFVREFATKESVRVRWLAPGGQVLADSARARSSADGGARSRDEGADETLSSPRGIARRHDGSQIEVSFPHSGGERASMRAGRALATASIVIVALLVLVTLLATRRAQETTQRLGAVIDAISAGELGARTHRHGGSELDDVATKLDGMVDGLVRKLEAAHEEEQRLRTVLDSMVEGVFVTDRDGLVVRTSRALSRLADGDPLGRTPIEVVRSPELHAAVRDALRKGATPRRVEVVLAQSGKTIAAHVSPLPSGAGVVVVLHDVTELRRADQVRRDFVANASHELRTPLAAIRGYAETLRDGAASDPALSEKFLRVILEHSKRLEQLVNDLLELSRAESLDANAQREPVELAPIVRKILRGLEVQAQARRVQLSLDVDDESVRVLGEEAGLEHVLGNLVDNAIKYNREDGSVTVRCRARGPDVVIEVVDTGPGIAAAHLPRIFERFYRVDAGRSRAAGGTGLGLAIVKHHVLRMGGQIDVESIVGTGTTFRIRLRAADAGV